MTNISFGNIIIVYRRIAASWIVMEHYYKPGRVKADICHWLWPYKSCFASSWMTLQSHTHTIWLFFKFFILQGDEKSLLKRSGISVCFGLITTQLFNIIFQLLQICYTKSGTTLQLNLVFIVSKFMHFHFISFLYVTCSKSLGFDKISTVYDCVYKPNANGIHNTYALFGEIKMKKYPTKTQSNWTNNMMMTHTPL